MNLMCAFLVPNCLHFTSNVDFHTNEAEMIKLRNQVYLRFRQVVCVYLIIDDNRI